MKRIGILTGGGDAQGLNAVIRAAVKTAINVYDCEVYGIRKLRFNDAENVVRVEYDRSRLNDDSVTSLLRQAGMDIQEKLVPA